MPKHRLGWRVIPEHVCVGCGYCCLAVPCFYSAKKHGPQPKCPELKWDDEKKRYVCLEHDNPELSHLMGVGCPCSSNLNTWRKDVKFRG